MNDILISVERLRQCLAEPGLLILDASVELPAPAFDGDYRVASGLPAWRQGHIPGARHADLLHELADPEAPFSFALPGSERLGAALGRLGVGEARRIVIYDRHDGFWAARLWWTLRSLGIPARVLDGGLKAWRGVGLAVHEGDEPAASPGSPLQASPRPGYWVDSGQVEAIVAGQAPGQLVCTLSAGLFEGSAVTRYARRGHIPGSHNRPSRSLLDDQARYLPRAVLGKRLGDELLRGEEPLVLYCGGGISAAAVALGLTLLGREKVSIYDGSLQEWASIAELPMTTGAAPA
ncbi:sulfurtransferase [Stutzerimonas kirkiae]|uniref:Sulfurtransferase n=1 Tax=Stutzerimonas kirkiae TaxID=2211392 RepID=A0A4Q9RCS4_9GAMM|nr:rhodanese-like domain-containing protein [Stutzerimonas kirkiae]TBU98972.1 sulfurtransferase [Stutzerimonas kirkiae]TBV01622.1 sulfurtransferase [Stutzerimonas kirkiae]